MSYSNKDIEKMERAIPEKAARAVKVAYKKAINSGQSVLLAVNGRLYQVVLGETRKEIKQIPGRIPIQRGLKIKLK
jgi:hypothetical protein